MCNFFLKTSLSCLLLLFMNSCSNKCMVNDIEVSELLSTVAKEKSIDYCRLLKIALEGDEDSIKRLSLLQFNDAVGYDHGAVIVNLVLHIGEEKYLKSILTINREEKYLIESYLDIGLVYGNNLTTKNKDLKKVFPDICKFLKQ